VAWRWKSSGDLVVGIRANRKASTARWALKEAGSETRGATYRNRIGGVVGQGERARVREALTTKGQAA
jgi:hypothetical protein